MADNDFTGLVIPEHISLILDGNGRWAKKRGLPRKLGHKAGFDTLEQIIEDASDIGVKYLTLYGFSTENWKRSEEEISALMMFFRYYIRKFKERSMKNNVRLLSMGQKSRFPKDIIELLDETIEETKNNTGITVIAGLDYGSRDEITRGVRKLARDIQAGILNPEDITEDTISASLDTAGIPDPDLLIRTSGEIRLSNYMLWQLAYSEMYFPEVLWPDFTKEHLLEAIKVYNKRNRRFGGR